MQLCVSSVIGARKPDLAIFEEAAKLCELPLAGWMIGDSPEADVAGGFGTRVPEYGPSRRANDPDAAPAIVDNPWHGRADGASVRRILEDGCLGPPSGIHRAGRRDCGSHRDVVGIHAVVLAVGEISWLTAAFVALAGFLWAGICFPRAAWVLVDAVMLIHDTVRARSSAQRS